MSAVSLDFASSGGEAVQKQLDNITKALAKSREQVRQLNEASKRSSQESTAGWNKELSSITSLVGGYVSAGAAIGVLSRAAQGLRDDFKAAREEHLKLQKQMAAGAVSSGNIPNLPAIDKFSKTGPGTPAQNLAALAGVQKEMPYAKFESQKNLAEQISRLSQTGMGEEQLTKMGGLAGQLSDLLPNDKAGDLADAALLVSQRAGGDLEKMGGDKYMGAMKRLQGAGMSGEGALGFGLAGLDANLPGTVLDKVSELVASSSDQLKPGSMGGATKADRDKNKAMLALSKMGGLERINALQNDPALASAALGATDALKFGQLTPDLIQKGEAAVRGRLSRDVVGDQLAEFQGTPVGAELGAEQSVSKAEADALGRMGPDAARTERARRYVRAQVKDKGLFNRMDAELGIQMGNLRELGPNGASAGETMISDAQARGHITGAQATEFRGLEMAIQANNRLLAEQNRLMSGEKKLNVDRHTE